MSTVKINTPEVLNIKKNCLGTIDIELKGKGMRKPQSFSVYPINAETKTLKIQSSTRIAQVDLNGKGLMSKSHQNGAFFHHLQLDKLTPFQFSENDWRQIVEYIGLTESKEAGKAENGVVLTDNSKAKSIFGLD